MTEEEAKERLEKSPLKLFVDLKLNQDHENGLHLNSFFKDCIRCIKNASN